MDILKILMTVLADRVLLVLSLLLNFALFAYCIAYPDYLRFATAGLFSITVFIPVLRTQGGQNVRQTRSSILEEENAA